jgi:hypothetical protein
MEPRTLAGLYQVSMYEALALAMLWDISPLAAVRIIYWRLQPRPAMTE